MFYSILAVLFLIKLFEKSTYHAPILNSLPALYAPQTFHTNSAD